MTVVLEPAPKLRRPAILPLENGDRLRSREFLRRYEAMPEVKKAELIEGGVYMSSPVSAHHGRPDSLIQAWLVNYAARTPGAEVLSNTTVLLDADNTAQPDALLRLSPGSGGRTSLDAKGYVVGGPELVVEIANSTASLDFGDKLTAYRRNGVREYLVWRTADEAFDWFVLEDEEYLALVPTAAGLLQGRGLPGLVLDVPALLALDPLRVLQALHTGLDSPAHAEFVARLRTQPAGR